MSAVRDIVFIHGWGLSATVWSPLIEHLRAQRPDLRAHCLDLPGYGRRQRLTTPHDLSKLADFCLQNSPAKALWVGWSLGGMVAMRAALMDEANRIQGLQLISTCAKFVADGDWPHGVKLSLFKRFADELSRDYARGLERFLILQTSMQAGSRNLVRQILDLQRDEDAPSAETLDAGLATLALSDLRDQVSEIAQPVQVVAGVLDRVVSPSASAALAETLHTTLLELRAGHAPFITHSSDVLVALLGLVNQVEAGA